VIELEPHVDSRGHFARTFCAEEFAAHGLATTIAQTSASRNTVAGTLRGMHIQADPHAETKLVRCVRGAIFDVIVDMRANSPSRLRWHGVRLDAETGAAIYVPAGFAHGFVTLEPDSDVMYQMSTPYAPDAARGLRWDDPALGIDWPCSPTVISARDSAYPWLART
jgi:dTDP-4-dehydrorhamnose 3,5-epimerase